MLKINYFTGMPVPTSLFLKSIKAALKESRRLQGKIFFVEITSGKTF